MNQDFFERRELHFSPHLNFCGYPLTKLAETYGTPLYVYGQSIITQRAAALTKVLQDVGTKHQASNKIFYAAKANTNIAIIKILNQYGIGCDIVSIGEHRKALLANVPPERIIFSGVGKTDDEIKQALTTGVAAFNVESADELERIAAIAKSSNKTAPVSLRVNPNIDAKTHPKISTGLHDNKFGISTDDAVQLIDLLGQHPHLKWLGMSCHIGSQIKDPQPLLDAAKIMIEFTRHAKSELTSLEFIDLGGGFGVSYHPEEPMEQTLDVFGKLLAEQVNAAGFNLYLEPGRSLVAQAGLLLTKVIVTKSTPLKSFVVIDASMSELIRPTLYEAYHHVMNVDPKTAKQVVDVVGPVCETGDYLAEGIELGTTAAGDLLAILDAGAYGFAMASHYNTRPKPAEVLIEDAKTARVIRKREDLDSLWRDEVY